MQHGTGMRALDKLARQSTAGAVAGTFHGRRQAPAPAPRAPVPFRRGRARRDPAGVVFTARATPSATAASAAAILLSAMRLYIGIVKPPPARKCWLRYSIGDKRFISRRKRQFPAAESPSRSGNPGCAPIAIPLVFRGGEYMRHDFRIAPDDLQVTLTLVTISSMAASSPIW